MEWEHWSQVKGRHVPALETLPGQPPDPTSVVWYPPSRFPKTVCWAPHSPVRCELPMPGLKPQRAETIFFESACSTTRRSPQGDRVRKWNSNHPSGTLFTPFPDKAQRDVDSVGDQAGVYGGCSWGWGHRHLQILLFDPGLISPSSWMAL